MKATVYTFLVLLTFSACQSPDERLLVKYQGNAQGTTYHVSILVEKEDTSIATAITQLLDSIDNSLSTYKENSLISRLNRNDSTAILDSMFIRVFNRSLEVSAETSGAFDATVAPLVSYWGFGPKRSELKPDTSTIDSLLELVGYQKMKLTENGQLQKELSGMKLDFNAIAQGYSVDLLVELLQSKGVKNMVVEIGGEVRGVGLNSSGKPWTVGIDKPMEGDETENRKDGFQAVVQLKNRALATSGNYRKFYEKDGKKISHTLDPKTGYPVRHTLLSASVIANDCMTADAYATAFMVMGVEDARAFLASHAELDAYLVYSGENGEYLTFATDGIKEYIK